MITSDVKEKWNACYLCGSEKSKPFYEKKDIVKCQNCSFIYYENIPSNHDLNLVYSGYQREEYITSNSVNKIRKELEEILKIKEIERVLDIACGECYVLDILKSINLDLGLYATEHSSARQNVIKKGYDFIEGEFFPITDLKFDLIIFTEAIEHINDINAFLKHANKLLSPGGLIYITTPNFSSIERRVMQAEWGMVTPPEHLSYFTPSTLNYALTRNNFKKVKSKTENISVFRIIEFINNRSQKSNKPLRKNKLSAQKISDNMQKITESNLLVKFIKIIINFVLDVFNLGSSMKVLYKKNDVNL